MLARSIPAIASGILHAAVSFEQDAHDDGEHQAEYCNDEVDAESLPFH